MVRKASGNRARCYSARRVAVESRTNFFDVTLGRVSSGRVLRAKSARYASSARFLRYEHEAAYLLAKGDVTPPAISDVIEFRYTGKNCILPKSPIEALKPIISAFCSAGGIVLDPFAGSGSTLAAAKELGRRYIGFEIDAQHHRTATARLADQLPA